MKIFDVKKKHRYMLTLQNQSNKNWFHKNTIGGKFAPKTKMYAFGFVGLGRISFYYT